MRKKKVWVYAGTGVAYDQPIELNKLVNPLSKNGFIFKGDLPLNNGQMVSLELINISAQVKRKNLVWVYANTGIIFENPVDALSLINPKRNPKNGLICEGQLQLDDNQFVDLELISLQAQKLRESQVWVYAGTGIIFEHPVDPFNLINPKKSTKNGFICEGQLQLDDNRIIDLELISSKAQKERQKQVWVYAATGVIYEGPVEYSKLIAPQRVQTKNGFIIKASLGIEGNRTINLELISSLAQKERTKQVWVYAKTGIAYENAVDASSLLNPKVCPDNGFISQGDLQLENGTIVALELITVSAQKKRVNQVWVYAGTGIAYAHPVDVFSLINPKKNPENGFICGGQLQLDDNQVIDLELISLQAKKRREKQVWVYEGTGTLYENSVDPTCLIKPEYHPKYNYLYKGQLVDSQNQSISLELVASQTQKRRFEQQQLNQQGLPRVTAPNRHKRKVSSIEGKDLSDPQAKQSRENQNSGNFFVFFNPNRSQSVSTETGKSRILYKL
ncbi:hypothetical protein [Legionella jordanis]|uniref:Uncharacterized protein n=1 Tax=Legionella jordanis TaxID=456 RepID=A0A0W0V8F1_9GAMM|nr:hypothetical protein [Legionella jordanis]KTD16386.1 hypothetical protein Ljor_0692 [Legionella jordanis]RMX04408.1 hypothetical protein EAW55_02945 [Legionella jordanis]VEH12153.1 Uncharacterised protein [Legionella jordanis]